MPTNLPAVNTDKKNAAFGVLILVSFLAAYFLSFLMNVNAGFAAIVFLPICYIWIFCALIGLGAFLRSRLTATGLVVVAALYLLISGGLFANYNHHRSVQDKRQAQMYVLDIPVYPLSQAPPGYYILGGKWTASATTSDTQSPIYVKVAHATYQSRQSSSRLFTIDEFSGTGHNPPSHCNYDPLGTVHQSAELPSCTQIDTMPNGEPIWQYHEETAAASRDYLMTKVAKTNVSMMVYLNDSDFTLDQYVDILKSLRTTPM